MLDFIHKPAVPLITYGNITDVITDKIREMILDGQVRPGEWLRQADLAQALGVSAMPVREALRALEAAGLVVFHPRRGAMVTRFSIPQLMELDQIMEELEVLACRWLAEDFGRISLDHMRRALANLEEAEAQHDINRRLKAVREFKFDLYTAAQRPLLLQILSRIFDMGFHYRRVFSGVAEVSSARVEAYRSILRACEEQDLPALITATRSLYALARDTVVAELLREDLAQEG